jgi:hypothetical protein
MDQAAILKEYKALRRALIPLNTRLVESLNEDEIQRAAAALGFLHGKRIELETEDQLSVMMDYAIHDLFRDGRNAVGRMLQDHPPREGSLEWRLLNAMQNAHYATLEVQESIAGLGVRCLDGPQKTPIVVVDVGFSFTADPGMGLAARVFSPTEDWWMTSGAPLPLDHNAADRVIRDLDARQHKGGGAITPQALSTMMIRAAIASGASQRVRYGDNAERDADDEAAPAPIVRQTPKTGRNDPCPCGSGKKYKKCCGG